MDYRFFLLIAVLSIIPFTSAITNSTCSKNNYNCRQCITDVNCGFCGSTGECLPGNKYGPTNPQLYAYFGNCPSMWQYAFGSQVIRTIQGFPVNPGFADVFLYPNDPVTMQVNITRPFSDDVQLDLMVVQDTSGSMQPYIKEFGAILPTLMSELIAAYRSSAFGYNSFIDKTGLSWGSWDSFSNYPHQFLTPKIDVNTLNMQMATFIAPSTVHGNGDTCEGTIESMIFAMNCQNINKWRTNSRKFMFVASDACYHYYGEFVRGSSSYYAVHCGRNFNTFFTTNNGQWKYYCRCVKTSGSCAGCTVGVYNSNLNSNGCYAPNATSYGGVLVPTAQQFIAGIAPFNARNHDLKCSPDPNGNLNLPDWSFPYKSPYWSMEMDFPTTDQVRDTLLNLNIIPIFGSIDPSGTDPTWKPLLSSWGFGKYTYVSSGPQSTLDAILTSVDEYAATMKLITRQDTYSQVSSISPTTAYTNVQILSTVSFSVTFKSATPTYTYLYLYSLGYPDCNVTIWNVIPCFGCDGLPDSGKVLDKCGICDPPAASKDNCLGCDGIPNSGKVLDSCGVCGGDNSKCVGCDAIINSTTKVDACGVCGGDNSTCTGCDGKICAPTNPLCTIAVVDNCNVCKGNDSCIGCDGNKYMSGPVPKTDKCGICQGNDACLGCDGIPYSGKVVDVCGVCGGNNTCVGCDGVVANLSKGEVPKKFDVCGVCAGDNSSCIGCDGKVSSDPPQFDFCGECGGNNTCIGCDGQKYINKTKPTVDLCGICGGNNGCLGCDGIPNSGKVVDVCGVCGGNNTCVGCDGVIANLSKGEIPTEYDLCGVCGGVNDCFGCDGKMYNLSIEAPPKNDQCDVCGGNGTSCLGCDGRIGSGLVFDGCGICDGDNSTCSGCDGIPYSTKVLDRCNVCGGNNSCLVVPKQIQEPTTLSPAGIAGIVAGSIVGLLIGILAPVLYMTINRAVNGANWFLPSDVAGKLSQVKNNPLYKGSGTKVNPLADKKR